MMKDDDFKLLRGSDDGQTTFVNVGLLLHLKLFLFVFGYHDGDLRLNL